MAALNASEIAAVLDAHGYELDKKLGEGGFAVVYKVKSRKYVGYEFVAKIMKVDPSDHARVEAFDNEIGALCHMDHPNVIKIYGHFFEGSYYVQILEYCARGSLKDMMEAKEVQINSLRRYMQGVVRGLCECHRKGFVHNDIKPANILVDSNDRAKLADFGLSKLYKDRECDSEVGFIKGSLPFIAPEMLCRTHARPTVDRFKTDVWALGITLYQLGTGRLPWTAHTRAEMLEEIKRGMITLPIWLENNLKQTIKAILVPAERRPRIEDVEALPFFGEGAMSFQTGGSMDCEQSDRADGTQATPKRRLKRIRTTRSQADLMFKGLPGRFGSPGTRLLSSPTFLEGWK